VEGAQAVSTAQPGTWNIHGYVDTPICAATEAIPPGYGGSGQPAGTCYGYAPGSCTLTNTLLSGLDADNDTVDDTIDNCPQWPNANQWKPDWFDAPNDPDCDSFETDDETFMGTDPAAHCPATPAKNDEAGNDAWPADADDDQRATTLDLAPYVYSLNTLVGNPNYAARQDLDGNGAVNVLDLGFYVNMLNDFCTGP
jgi:hypothetical protein